MSTFIKAFFDTNWITNLIDILIITFLLFLLFKFLKNTKAAQVLKGLIVLVALYFLASFLDLQGCLYIFKFLFDNLLIILIIIFAPEIRRIFEGMGKRNTFTNELSSIFRLKKKKSQAEINAISEICDACKLMSESKTGALIIFEKESSLNEIAGTGKAINADISSELLQNIFFKNSPLHDGALIIRNNQILAAGCILPVSGNNEIKSKYGTRHRAGIGISEQTDCISVIVSEETGDISVAMNGKLYSGYTYTSLKKLLLEGGGEYNA